MQEAVVETVNQTMGALLPVPVAQPAGENASAESEQYLTFMLTGEVYAMGILAVKEIIEYHSITQVPMMPPSVRGVINLRGAVVPVLDLMVSFGQESSPVTKRTCIVIAEVMLDGNRQVLGVVVDAVNEVLDIAQSEIEPPPAFGARIRTDFIRGMGKVKGNFIIILNLAQIFSAEDLQPLDEKQKPDGTGLSLPD